MTDDSIDTSSIQLVVTLQLESTKKEMTKKSKGLEKAEEEVRSCCCYSSCPFEGIDRAHFSPTPFMKVIRC